MVSKWDREQRIRDDHQQTVFLEGKAIQKPQQITENFNLTGNALCPFCMNEEPVDKFIISTKKGFHHGLGKCPKCENQSQWKSLRMNWTPEKFAEWVREYTPRGFWQKVKYTQFNQGLRRKGWLDQFWTRYKELKGQQSDETESYSDHIARASREWSEQEGLIQGACNTLNGNYEE